jgi:LacI family transcriptional regulator
MQEAHLLVRSEFLREGALDVEGGYVTGKQLLQLDTPPTAILASNNKLLLGLLRAIEELQIDCPKSLSILGFDDYIWNAHFRPRITTVVQQTEHMGKIAFAMLLSQMKQPETVNSFESGTMIRLRAQLVVRDSTAPPPENLRQERLVEDDLEPAITP